MKAFPKESLCKKPVKRRIRRNIKPPAALGTIASTSDVVDLSQQSLLRHHPSLDCLLHDRKWVGKDLVLVNLESVWSRGVLAVEHVETTWNLPPLSISRLLLPVDAVAVSTYTELPSLSREVRCRLFSGYFQVSIDHGLAKTDIPIGSLVDEAIARFMEVVAKESIQLGMLLPSVFALVRDTESVDIFEVLGVPGRIGLVNHLLGLGEGDFILVHIDHGRVLEEIRVPSVGVDNEAWLGGERHDGN
jgi:hypothetical protein